MKINEYKCPACTGPLVYSAEKGKLVCEYCGSEYELSMFEDKASESEDKTEEDKENNWGDDAAGMKIYQCPSCGAELICDETTASTQCPYCGNNNILQKEFDGGLKPDYILPFAVTKDQAVQSLKDYYKGKHFLNKTFKSDNKINEIQGIYVPFWLFDCRSEGYASYEATRSRTTREGDYEVTRTQHFHLERAGSLEFEKIPTDGLKRLDDALMDSIEPFYYKDLKPFSTIYMPGFMADKYDVTAEENSRRAILRCQNSFEAKLRETTVGYDTVAKTGGNCNVSSTDCRYALLPVWILHTKWKDKDYIFAMNGQTGKFIGNLPIDPKLAFLVTLRRFLIASVIAYPVLALIFALIGGM